MMRKVLIGLAMAGCLSAAASAPAREKLTDEQRFAKLTQGLVPGQPQQCLISRDTGSAGLTAVGSRLIYKAGRGLLYVNETTGGCENVARDDILITRSYSGRLCDGDIARTVNRSTPQFTTGSCTLGRFIPYTRPR